MLDVTAEMAATVWLIEVAVGDEVRAGQDLVILESMKMEIPVSAAVPGVVRSIQVELGQAVAEGDVLVVIERTAG